MSEEAKLTALLHLAAVVTVLTLAFLGLDSPHIEVPNFTDGMKEAKSEAKDVLLRLGFSGKVPFTFFGKQFIFRIRTGFPAAIIGLIAEEPLRMGLLLSVAHVAYRQTHVPLLGYFKKWNHMRVMRSIAIFSTLTLIVTVWSIIWNDEWYHINTGWFEPFAEDWIIELVFGFLTCSLLWVLWTGRCMRVLSAARLKAKCKILGRQISERFIKQQRLEQQQMTEARKKLRTEIDVLQKALDRRKRALNKLDDGHGGGAAP